MIFFRILALSLLLASCSSNRSSSKQTLHLNIAEDATSLDPRVVRRIKDLTLVRHLFEGLTRADVNGTPQLALADDFSIADDGMTYTFHLRDAVWTNGERITADDFVYSWKKTLDPSFATEYAHMLYPIKNGEKAHSGRCSPEMIGVKAVDARTLQVKLERPTPHFLELVSFPTFFPVNRNVDLNFPHWTNPPGKQFVSCGPFKLEKWAPDQEIILRKSENYWDASSVFLNKLEFSMIADNNTESLLFKRGELDWLGQPLSNSICSELLGKLKEKEQLDSYPIAGTFWFKCNVEKEPFNNAKIRKAFALAVPRQEIIEHILQGSQTVALSPLPPTLALVKEPHLFEDEKAAVALFEEGLSEMGWTRELLPNIELMYHNNERTTKIAQYVQQIWQQLFQVPIHLHQQEYQIYRSDSQTGNFQIASGEWIADYHDPLAFLEIFLETSNINETNWCNSRFEELVQLSSRSAGEKRAALLKEAEKILLDEMPVIPLYHYSFDYVKKRGVEGVVLSPLGGGDFKTAHIR